MKDLLEDLTMEDFDGDQLELAEVVGIDIYKKLVRIFGGNSIRVYQAETLVKDKRAEEIRAQYNGRNMLELTQRYQISDRTIRNILGTRRCIPGQIDMFGE